MIRWYLIAGLVVATFFAFWGLESEEMLHRTLPPELSDRPNLYLENARISQFGSHGQNHVRLAECNIDIATTEIKQSRVDLETKFGHPIEHFCYPYGNYNDEIVTIAKASGYSTATTVNRGRVKSNNNLLTLPRISITHRTFAHLFLMKILSKYEDKRGT